MSNHHSSGGHFYGLELSTLFALMPGSGLVLALFFLFLFS